MQILSHRGYWKNKQEQNKKIAFNRSFESGFGTETDIRDLAGELVISHDLPVGGELTVEEFFKIYCKHDKNLPLALNIKSDGLQEPLKLLIEKYSIANYFVFDMSIPDTLKWIEHRVYFFSRESEFEPIPSFQEEATGIWIDCFLSDWISESQINKYLVQGKKVCLVSPDLHHREHHTFWKYLQTTDILHNRNLMLCTDFPEEAKLFFS